MELDRKRFYGELREIGLFRGISQDQVDGTNALLDAWEGLSPKRDDHRALAYVLATVYHETGRKMLPMRETGRGMGRAYGKPEGIYHQVYYGRGQVQLTWHDNYVKADAKLHKMRLLAPNMSLVKVPDLLLDLKVSAAITVVGMVDGWFTTRKLGQYFNAQRCDWVNARAIINGLDRAKLIAGYAMQFAHCLEHGGAKNGTVGV